MTNYAKGRGLEYRAKYVFEKNGYVVDRKTGSKPTDLVVKRNGVVKYICECKKTSRENMDVIYVPKKDVERALAFAKRDLAKALVVFGFYRSPVYTLEASKLRTNGAMFRISKEEGEELEEYLKSNLNM
jgi:Holliday junction resolvase